MLKLKDSGYSQEFRTQIVLSAKQGFQSQLEKDRQGLRPLYRDRKRILADQKERGRGKVDWWNKTRGGQQSQTVFSTVIFVPPTPGAALARKLQEREIMLNSAPGSNRIKVVEGPGIKLKSLVVDKNPYPVLPCHRPLCPLCNKTPISTPSSQPRYPCTTPGVGYIIDCKLCKEEGKSSRYEGETGRPAVTRCIEHVKHAINMKPFSPLLKHSELDHPLSKKQVRFEFKIESKSNDPLTRQAREGVRISNPTDNAKIINSKAEFNHPPICRISIQK